MRCKNGEAVFVVTPGAGNKKKIERETAHFSDGPKGQKEWIPLY